MRAYYINLARRADRRAVMEQRFADLGIAAIRVEALTPTAVTEVQRRAYCNPLAYRWQTEAEVACSLSHLAAMRALVDSGDAYAAIFEDDAILSPALPHFLARFEANATGIDLLRLETDNSRLRLPAHPERHVEGYAVFRLHSAGGGAAAYLISRRAAQRALAGTEMLADLTDQALFNPYAKLARDLVARQLSPALAVQEDRIGQSADRVGSDLEALRRHRGSNDGRLFWLRLPYNIYDFIERDIVVAARNLWLKHVRGVIKYAIPFKTD